MGRSMEIAGILLAFFCLAAASVKADYVVCATSDHTEACKRVEATRKDVRCLKVADSTECLQQILKGKAHFGTFTPEEAILASYYINDQVRVVAEIRHPDKPDEKFAFETVAVVHKNFTGGLSGLQNSTYYHPGFTQGRYWSDRVLKHFETTVVNHFAYKFESEGKRRTADEDALRKLSSIFRSACRPGAWSVSDWWDKKLKKEYGSLCASCDFPSECSYKSEAYNEHFSALRCLTRNNEGVAYTALGYVTEYFNLKSEKPNSQADPNDYRFLCTDGSTRILSLTDTCSWIRQPWTVVLSLSSATSNVTSFLREVTEPDLRLTGWKIALKKIVLNGGGILNFIPGERKLADHIQEGRVIPKVEQKGRFLDWCTISNKEKSKCEYMASAALAFGVPMQIKCSQADSKIECLKKIHNNQSDVTFIDTQLGFAARKVYNLTSAAFVETEKTGNYYGVVVIKGNKIKKFRDLKGTSACLPVYNGLGWLSHVQTVRRLNLVPNMLCSDSRGLWNFFSKACVPGAKSNELNKFSDLTPNKLCQSCTSNKSGTAYINCITSGELLTLLFFF
ncbi:UNVERIFIED_CONTAM: hypothetical protein PYX00_007775 [Menopon gallinae]|uniref:Transferrin-like domain-containing protein n=1 Tax=Menopon gallinae TaxID=328185 RepID=A0AAW2HL17_9NEOP